MSTHQIKFVGCILLVGALAACASGPPRQGPRGMRPPGDSAEDRTAPRPLKNSAGLLIASFDSDDDLQISRAELNAGIDRAFARADQNSDGDIAPLEFEAFSRAALDGGKSPPFRLDFDRDVDGRISLAEFRAEISAIASGLDADKDGVVSHAEMRKAFETQAGPRSGTDNSGAGEGGPPPGGDREGGRNRPR